MHVIGSPREASAIIDAAQRRQRADARERPRRTAQARSAGGS
jgi:hypothetical protein